MFGKNKQLMSKPESGDKLFPIKSKTACMLKWSWSTINLQNAFTTSCHRVDGQYFDPDDFDNFHNLPEKLEDRELMKQGKWPGRGCEYCERVETSGGVSDRQLTLMREHVPDKVPPELFRDPGAVAVTPTILEIYFNNTCNQSCVYCAPQVSSQIDDEVKKFGEIEIGDFSIRKLQKNKVRQQDLVKRLWNYLETDERYKTIRHFNVLGGEPLLQKEFQQTVDFWDTHPNPSLTLNFISNLNLPPESFRKRIASLEKLVKEHKIYTVEITASIDCWGPQQDYVRWGMDLENVFVPNFEYLLAQDWITVGIHSCIASLTIKTMPELVQQIAEWNRQYRTEIDYSFDLIVGQSWLTNGMHPLFFGPGVFDKDFERVLAAMPTDTDKQKSTKQHMSGIASAIENGTRDDQKIQYLKQYLTTLDQRRNTNWEELFPWLKSV